MMNERAANEAMVASESAYDEAAQDLAEIAVDHVAREVTIEVLAEIAIHFQILLRHGAAECDRRQRAFFSPRQAVLESVPPDLHQTIDDWFTDHMPMVTWIGRTLKDTQ